MEISEASHISPDLSEMQLQGAPSTHTVEPPLVSNAQIYVVFGETLMHQLNCAIFPNHLDWLNLRPPGMTDRARDSSETHFTQLESVCTLDDQNSVEQQKNTHTLTRFTSTYYVFFFLLLCCESPSAVSGKPVRQHISSMVVSLQLMWWHFVLLFCSSFIVCFMARTALLSAYTKRTICLLLRQDNRWITESNYTALYVFRTKRTKARQSMQLLHASRPQGPLKTEFHCVAIKAHFKQIRAFSWVQVLLPDRKAQSWRQSMCQNLDQHAVLNWCIFQN